MYIIILENEGFWATKVTIFQKYVSGLIMSTNLKNVHHQQDYIFFLIFK